MQQLYYISSQAKLQVPSNKSTVYELNRWSSINKT